MDGQSDWRFYGAAKEIDEEQKAAGREEWKEILMQGKNQQKVNVSRQSNKADMK